MKTEFDTEREIRAAQNGDTAAFGRLVLQYERMLLTFAVYRMPVREEAREAVQDTFIRAYEQIAEFRAGADFGIWLRSICGYMILNRINDYNRRRRKHEDYIAQLELLAVNAISGSRSTDYQRDPLDQLSACIDKLSQQSQELIAERSQHPLYPRNFEKNRTHTNVGDQYAASRPQRAENLHRATHQGGES